MKKNLDPIRVHLLKIFAKVALNIHNLVSLINLNGDPSPKINNTTYAL